MKQHQNTRGLFYTRDSGGRHEMTPGEYVAWAQRQAVDLGVTFSGTPELINKMIRTGRSVEGDVFLDFAVKGNVLAREALDAMIREALTNPNVTHVFIPRRDRLARPDNPLDAIELENVLRKGGITLVFMDKTYPPLSRGKRQDIAELILGVLEYDRSAEDRRDLAEKIIHAQIALAKLGFSVGGRPPFGFRRWLAKDDGTAIRQLADGERVRMQGHHVVWLPGPDEELDLIRRILRMLRTMPASRVAATLTAEGIPSPDAGRYRKDNGVRHLVSGVWHQTTITNIARNPLLVAIVKSGSRSMGDQMRFTPTGPRELDDTDFRSDDKPKVVQNEESNCITATAKFDPLVDHEEHNELIQILDERGGTQRGKPRSSDPATNPLGSRVFDMNCGWPMYREPYGKSYRYKCGLYQQSHGQRCRHNHVQGVPASRFVLSCIRQKLMSPRILQKLHTRLQELAADASATRSAPPVDIEAKRAALWKIDNDLDTTSRNMALAENPDQYKAISRIFDELQNQKRALITEIEDLDSRVTNDKDTVFNMEKVMAIAERVTELAREDDEAGKVTEMFKLVNANLFVAFHPVKVKKRTLNKVQGGVLTFGACPPPIDLYKGPTSRHKIKNVSEVHDNKAGVDRSHTPRNNDDSDEEGKSLGNVNRGDWI